MSVASYIDLAPWLNAKLQNSVATENSLQYELKKNGSVDVVLECSREPTEDEILAASRKQFELSITLQIKRDNGQTQNLRVDIVEPRLQTLKWRPPEIQVEQYSALEISRVEKKDSQDVDLFNLTLKQPATRLEFAGAPTAGQVFGNLTCSIAGESKELQSYLLLGSSVQKSEQGVPFELLTGAEISLPCMVSIDELFYVADCEDKLFLQFDWTCSFNEESRSSESGRHEFEVELRQGEILALKYRNTSAVPNMTTTLTSSSERFPLEFSVPISGGSVQFELGDTIEFEVECLDDSWDLVAHARIQPASETHQLKSSDDFNLIQNFRLENNGDGKFQIPFDNTIFSEYEDTDKYQLLIRFEAQRLKLQAGVALLDGDDVFERRFGTVTIDIVIRQRDPKFLFCLDYGASAIAAWFGRVERNLVRQLIPIGSFAYNLAGAHAEYDPNKKSWQNVLLPSTVGLNPNKHLRSRKAPLSYGNLTMVGSRLPSAEKRMEYHNRTYDVSLPVDRDFLLEDDAKTNIEAQATIIPDLKRILMNADTELKHRTKQSVLERTANGLQATREIDLEALTKDVFHELGSYLIPNALHSAHEQLDNPITGEIGDDRFTQWLEHADTDVQVVVTHPSGIAQNKQHLYKNAGKSLTVGLTGSSEDEFAEEPRLIPEALAAAYFGISRYPISDEGTEVFACIDIGASTVDASLIEAKMRHDSIESWTVFAHFGATIGGANLDDALISTLIQNLRKVFSASDPVFQDLELDHHFLRDEALKKALLPRIQDAKRALSETLIRKAGANGEYRWAGEGEGSSFSVELNEIVRSAASGNALTERMIEIPGTDGKVILTVTANAMGGQSIYIKISPEMLDASESSDFPTRSNPQTVARTLGHAVPAMLIREARRLNVPDPKWIVTGRASLWPSIFSGIRHTAEIFDQDVNAAPLKPFDADDMKNATVYGAARLATAGLEITDGVDHSYALVLHDEGRGTVSDIEYLDTRTRSEGNKSVRFLPNRWLSRVLPGLDEVGSDQEISREEIVQLFGIFGQKIIVDQCQVKPGGLAGGQNQLVDVSWKRRNSDVEFTVGDVIIRQSRNRLAGT